MTMFNTKEDNEARWSASNTVIYGNDACFVLLFETSSEED